jgi:hypothetical protein
MEKANNGGGVGLRKKAISDEERREAARLMGSLTSDRKARSSAENGKLAPPGPGRSPKPLEEYPCTCAVGDSLDGHRWNCPRGQAIKRRRKAGTL